MTENVKSHSSHIGRYILVGGSLLILTGLTVGASYVQLATFAAVTLGLAIAITKGTLVLAYFMHLLGEHKVIYGVLILTLFFFLVLLFIPLMTDSTSYESLLKN